MYQSQWTAVGTFLVQLFLYKVITTEGKRLQQQSFKRVARLHRDAILMATTVDLIHQELLTILNAAGEVL